MLGRKSPPKVRTEETSLQRSDTVIDSTVVEGNLVAIKKPKFITLVGLPANQTGLKIIRSATPPAKGTPNMNTILRRTRRSAEKSPVLRIAFPSTLGEAEVTTKLEEFGLVDYKVEKVGDSFTATRSDLKSISKDTTMEIKLSDDGIVATVARQDTATEGGTTENITMASVSFDAGKFSLEEVQRWVAEKCVDGTIQEPQNSGESYVVRRSEVKDNEETRQLVLEDGVTATIVRSCDCNVPDGMVSVVCETAYGSWGWGQLDFAAKMADTAFCEQMDDALYSLRSVLYQIIISSALPLDTRKELALRALGQFGEYASAVMDSLPRQLLASVVRSANPSQSEKPMTQQSNGGASNPATPSATPAAASAPAAALTREDVASVMKEGLAEFAKTLAPTAFQRADETTPPAKTDPVAEVPASLVREDVQKMVTEATAPILDAIKGLQGTTMVRSATEAVPAAKEGETRDVFRGATAFAGLRTGKK